MPDDLVGLECRLNAVGQLRDEEPRVEPAGHDRRGRPVADRDEEVRAQSEIQLLRDVGHGRAAGQQPLARGPCRVPVEQRLGKEDAGLLEQLAQRGDVTGQRLGRGDVAAERGPGVIRGEGRSRCEPRIQVAGVDGAAGKHVHVGREGHRRWPAGQQDFGTAGSRPEEDDGRGGPGSSFGLRHVPHVPGSDSTR